MSINQGVRQGCVASLHVLALYTYIFMTKLGSMEGFGIGATVVNNIWYVDDTVIVAESEMQPQRLIIVVVVKSVEKGLHLNIAKSFSMVFSKSVTTPTCHIDVRGDILEEVQSFIYLGSLFSSDARCEKEIRRRIGVPESSFTSLNKVLTSRNIDMSVRVRVLNAMCGQLCYMVVRHGLFLLS